MRPGTIVLLSLALAGCGVSPELVEEPEVPQAPASDAPSDEEAGDSRQTQTWQCAGSTAATRQQGRIGRHQSVEGFSSRNCIAPSTEVELNPNP